VSLGRVPEDREPSTKLAAENTENTEGISAPARRPAATECATRMYALVCVRAQRAHNQTSEKFFHCSGENCVGIVNGRHGRTGPISHEGRTHPENGNEK